MKAEDPFSGPRSGTVVAALTKGERVATPAAPKLCACATTCTCNDAPLHEVSSVPDHASILTHRAIRSLQRSSMFEEISCGLRRTNSPGAPIQVAAPPVSPATLRVRGGGCGGSKATPNKLGLGELHSGGGCCQSKAQPSSSSNSPENILGSTQRNRSPVKMGASGGDAIVATESIDLKAARAEAVAAVEAAKADAEARTRAAVNRQDLSAQSHELVDSGATVSVLLEGVHADGGTTFLDKLGVFMPTGSELNGRPT